MKLFISKLLIVIVFFVSFFTLFFNPIKINVHAGCSGTIICGSMQYRCSVGGWFGCTPPGFDSVCTGSCTLQCNQNWSPYQACSGISNEAQCNIANASNSCTSGCSISPDTPCTWIPPCTFTAWTDGACDDGDCAPTERRQYRTVNPPGCTNSTRCVSDPTCVVAPTPSCNLDLTPATVNPLLIGGTSDLTAALSNIQDGSVSEVTFSSSNSGVATVSPASDSSSPYNSTVTGVTPGSATITARGIMNGSSRCSDTTVITVPAYSCTVDLVPDNAGTINTGDTATFIANVNPTNGLVTQVNFTSGNTTFVTVNPASDNTVVYSTIATGVSEGPTTVRADVIMGGSSICNDTSTITIAPPGPWWQVRDGDITTNGNITSAVPGASYLNIIGLGGYPGVPVYAGSLGFSPGSLSVTNWSANTSTTQGRLFDYSYFNSLIPDSITPTVATDVSLRSPGFIADGYEWFKATSNLSIDSNIDFTNRKVILFVEGGSLSIAGKINLTDNVGFFGTFVEGDITIDPLVGGTPSIEGIYLVSGSFNTGLGNTQLHARGSIASFGGINLQRDLADNTSPAELFEFGPDQVLLFPSRLAFRRTKWVEVAP